jgi:glycosyltransferase involved in cell wall biosynthesis
LKPTPTIAFVAPWYGDIPGGMETLTRQTAERLAARGWPIEIVTTCIADFYADWGRNHHKPGLDNSGGLPVRRFAVQPRDQAAFDEVNWRLMNNLPITAAQEQIYIQQLFRTPDLFAYLKAHQRDYLFFFIPYMFPTTYYGAQIAPERSAIIPCLHDESYARLNLFKQVIPQARALLFNSYAEAELTERLFPSDGRRDDGRHLDDGRRQWREMVGVGVDTDIQGDAARFYQRHHLPPKPTLLYVGRRDAGKNVPLLIDYWRRYRQETDRDARLLLIGPGQVTIPPEAADSILDLGFVSAQDKYDAYAAATATCQPSLHESFSIVLMESWLLGTPALVHGRCAVTVDHCRRSNGGLYFANYEEFVGTLNYLFDQPEMARRMGRAGRAYVHHNFAWEIVLDKYEQIIQRLGEGVANR